MNQIHLKQISSGMLYIVPTPIGNLNDISQRALNVLSSVDLTVAEDTRRTGFLLKHFSIRTKLSNLHSYNEQKKSKILLTMLKTGKNIALVSDGGTPLINDPGYQLVRSCCESNIRVIPLPGACAAIVALSASGLPSNRFSYEGFLPTKTIGRRNALREIAYNTRTSIFYESTHRVLDSLQDIILELGIHRYVVLARELTKTWESIYGAPVKKLFDWVKEDKNRYKGEIVLIVEGYKEDKKILTPNILHTLRLLQKELPLKTATSLTAKIYNVKKKLLYKYALMQP